MLTSMAREKEARKRALRAARAVTLGVSMTLGGAACSASHPAPGDASPPTDAAPDGASDATADADTGVDCSGDDWWSVEECCEASGGFWDPSGGCAVPGPFVPPAMHG